MPYSLSAAAVIIIHFLFVLFTVSGGLLVLKSRKWVLVHLPAVLWGVVIEFAGWICPLTPLENWLLEKAGAGRYPAGFIEHYVYPILYPSGVTPDLQWVLGGCLIGINIVIYAWVFYKTRFRV